MPIFYKNREIKNLIIGDQIVNAVYYGTYLIWEAISTGYEISGKDIKDSSGSSCDDRWSFTDDGCSGIICKGVLCCDRTTYC